MSEMKVSFTQPGEQPTPERPFIVRLLLGLTFGVGAIIVGALGWGLLAFFTGRVFFLVPLAVGAVVTVAMLYPFKRASLPLKIALLVPCLALTLTSALLGDYLFIALAASKELKLGILDVVTRMAPIFFDIARRFASPSTPMISVAPISFAPAVAHKPIGPWAKTTTASPILI